MRVEDLMCESRCKEPRVFSYCSFSMRNICILVFYCQAKAFMLDFMATAITFKFQHGSTDWNTGFIIPLYWLSLSHTSDDATAFDQIIQRRLTAIPKSLRTRRRPNKSAWCISVDHWFKLWFQPFIVHTSAGACDWTWSPFRQSTNQPDFQTMDLLSRLSYEARYFILGFRTYWQHPTLWPSSP